MEWLPDWFDDVGFFITFLGFAFGIPQIVGIKRKMARKLSGQDNMISIEKSMEIVSEIKVSVNEAKFDMVDRKIAEIKGVLITCKRVHDDKEKEINLLLQSLTDSQQNINEVLVNPATSGIFDGELFFDTLDETRDLFFEIIEKCKYD
jgi:hypothetical protein